MTRLADLRRDRGLSQEQLAQRSGITQPMISRLERSNRGMTVARAKALARVLECHWLDLLDEDVPRNTPEEQKLVDKFRGMSEAARTAFRLLADTVADNGGGPRNDKKKTD